MNLKKLTEQRAEKQKEMKALVDAADAEERSLNEEETEKFESLEKEIAGIDASIRAIQATRNLEEEIPPEEQENQGNEEKDTEERELAAFDAYIRGKVEERADANMIKGDNGAVIPTSIANKIITKVVDLCPIYHDADRYNVGGTLQIPYYDETTGDVTMTYADEFTDGESTTGTFGSISLTGYLARAITDVSKSLINNSQFNIVDFVVNRMALSIAIFLEKELLHGTTDKVEGLSGVKQTVTAAKADAVTADEVIELQEAIPDVYQGNAYFIMNKATRTSIRKLKDGQGNYLLNKDATSRWGYTLFGKDVYTSDSMPKMDAGKTAIFYGDYTGLAVKVSEEINIDILRETKARQHAVEVLGFVEFDAKVQNDQKIAKLVMKPAS
jgi:HK97 family phage major capsid protein